MGKKQTIPIDINSGDEYTYDEAVELTGHGRYNYLLLSVCSIISTAFALDIYGFATVVAAASCDLQMGLQEIGILAAAPLAGIIFSFPWGYYADTSGRRRALLVSTSGGFVFAAISSFSPSWQFMLAVKLIGSSLALVTSLGMMVAGLVSFIGVNVIGFVMVSHCELTFYIAALLALSGVVVSMFLPSVGKAVK